MSRSDRSIFDTSEEAAMTLEVVAKGMINVDDFPYDMRNGTHKIILEASSCILLEPKTKESSGSEQTRGQVIYNSFGEKNDLQDKGSKQEDKEEDEKSGEPGA